MFRARIVLALLVVVTLLSVAAPAMAAAPAATPPLPGWGNTNCYQWYTVRPGDNLYRLAIRYNTSVASLMVLNRLPNPNHVWAGQALCVRGSVANPYVGFYIVAPGDTLYSIAARHNVPLWLLARVNGIWNYNYIRVGQQLIIPDMANLH